MADFIKENNISLGISIDGPKEVNDKIEFLKRKRKVYMILF